MKKVILIILVFLAVAYPLILLFRLDVNIGYYDDWYDNLWFVGYWGEYFRQHLSFPIVINANEVVGVSLPIFYGYTLFPLLGLGSAILGSNLAVRIGLLLLYLFQFLAVEALVEKITGSKKLALAVACLVTWAIYPLTSIYNRGSLPEVYGGGFLTIAVCLFFQLFLSDKLFDKIRIGLLFSLAMIMIAGSFPPAAVHSLVILPVCFLIIRLTVEKTPAAWKKDYLVLLAAGFIFILVVFPSWYATKIFMNDLSVTSNGLSYYPEIDNFWVRFAPIPLDLRSVTKGIYPDLGTPYLEAQTNLPLFLFLLTVICLMLFDFGRVREKKRAIPALLLSILLFGFYTGLSLSPEFGWRMPFILTNIHFYYRYITFQNAALLVGIIAVLSLRAKIMPKRKDSQILNTVIVVCLTVSAIGVIIKNIHGNSVIGLSSYEAAKENFGFDNGNRDKLLHAPGTAGHLWGYRETKKYQVLTDEERGQIVKRLYLPVLGGRNFGSILPSTEVTLEKDGWLQIDMYPFSWNVLEIDGQRINQADIKLARDDSLEVAVKATKGRHRISVKTEPEAKWLLLRKISFKVFFGLLAVCLIIFWLPRRWRYRRENQHISKKQVPSVRKGRSTR